FLSDQLRQRLSGIFVVMRDVIAEVSFDSLEHRSPVRPLRWAVVADHIGSLCRTAQRQGSERNKGETEQLDFHGFSSRARHLCGQGLALSFFDTIVLQLDDKPHQSGRTEKNFTAARLATRRRRRSSAAQRNSNAKPTWAKSGHRRLFILVDQP